MLTTFHKSFDGHNQTIHSLRRGSKRWNYVCEHLNEHLTRNNAFRQPLSNIIGDATDRASKKISSKDSQSSITSLEGSLQCTGEMSINKDATAQQSLLLHQALKDKIQVEVELKKQVRTSEALKSQLRFQKRRCRECDTIALELEATRALLEQRILESDEYQGESENQKIAVGSVLNLVKNRLASTEASMVTQIRHAEKRAQKSDKALSDEREKFSVRERQLQNDLDSAQARISELVAILKLGNDSSKEWQQGDENRIDNFESQERPNNKIGIGFLREKEGPSMHQLHQFIRRTAIEQAKRARGFDKAVREDVAQLKSPLRKIVQEHKKIKYEASQRNEQLAHDVVKLKSECENGRAQISCMKRNANRNEAEITAMHIDRDKMAHRIEELESMKMSIDALRTINNGLDIECADLKKKNVNVCTERDALRRTCEAYQTQVSALERALVSECEKAKNIETRVGIWSIDRSRELEHLVTCFSRLQKKYQNEQCHSNKREKNARIDADLVKQRNLILEERIERLLIHQ